jgi:hypothetical protein
MRIAMLGLRIVGICAPPHITGSGASSLASLTADHHDDCRGRWSVSGARMSPMGGQGQATEIRDRIDDYALERVPDHERAGWLKLSWNTAGIVTTLIQLFFGAVLAFASGMTIAVHSGIFVVIVSMLGALSWLQNESIGQAGSPAVRQRLDERKYGNLTPTKFFDHCYRLRSRLVHGSDPPAENDIADVLGDPEFFVSDLLTAPVIGHRAV